MIKVICSDADGILNNLELYQEWMVEDYYTKKGLIVPQVKNPYVYDIREKYEISKRQRDIIWLQYFKHYCLQYEARKDAFDVLKKRQAEGKKICIVTARAFVTNILLGPTSRKWYEEWQSMYDFVPDEIAYCSEKNSVKDKILAVEAFKGDLMFEDKVDNLNGLLELCTNIALEAGYNKHFNPENKPFPFYMEKDWLGIDNRITEIENSRRFK